METNPFRDDVDMRGACEEASVLKDAEAPSRVLSDFSLILECYRGSECAEVRVPYGVTQILEGAFRGHDELVSIELPGTLQSIGPKAFSGCTSLREVRVPDGVFEMGQSAFSGCTALERVVLPDGLLRIEQSAFQGCSALAFVEGGLEVDELAGCAFSGCASLEDLPLLSHVRAIGSGAFVGCAFREVEFSQFMECIADGAFKSCRFLTRVVLPEEVDFMGNGVFLNCGSLDAVEGAERLAPRFPAAFPRSLTDALGILRPQDVRRETGKYIRRHAEEADRVREQLKDCRATVRSLRNKRDELGIFDRSQKQELECALEEERERCAELKARLETLEHPTVEQLAEQKRQAVNNMDISR